MCICVYTNFKYSSVLNLYPYLTYGLASWGQSLKTHLNRILILPRVLSVCAIHFANRHNHAIRFFVDANILPLLFLYYGYVPNLMHHINNNSSPLNILKLLQKNLQHTYVEYAIIHPQEFLHTKH